MIQATSVNNIPTIIVNPCRRSCTTRKAAGRGGTAAGIPAATGPAATSTTAASVGDCNAADKQCQRPADGAAGNQNLLQHSGCSSFHF
jgi:hypothetical protein